MATRAKLDVGVNAGFNQARLKLPQTTTMI